MKIRKFTNFNPIMKHKLSKFETNMKPWNFLMQTVSAWSTSFLHAGIFLNIILLGTFRILFRYFLLLFFLKLFHGQVYTIYCFISCLASNQTVTIEKRYVSCYFYYQQIEFYWAQNTGILSRTL
jgi:hypothetical protein